MFGTPAELEAWANRPALKLEVSTRFAKKVRRSAECRAWLRKLDRERRHGAHLRELREAMRPPVVAVSACELRASRRPRIARRRGAGRPRAVASRSCARSGDSGSSGDGSGSGGSEPPAALAGSWAGRVVSAVLSAGRAGR